MSRVAYALLGLLCVALAACSSDGSGNASGTTVSGCIERPDTLPRPPAGTLPCDLIPPGLSLGK
ncbi:MAG TPA: hypothetical protein VER11_21895 [Polyangiaceae bacterium]|nr:hypothetical protein [Polyangiaceae bacterium]